MFVSELLVGRRPWANTHYSALELPEKIARGERPPLPDDDSFNQLVSLVKLAWEQEGRRRPAAAKIVAKMKDPAFVMQHRRLAVPRLDGNVAVCAVVAVPPSTIEDAFDPKENERFLDKRSTNDGGGGTKNGDEGVLNGYGENRVDSVLWVITGKDDNRRLSVVDANTGKFYAKDSSFVGKEVVALTAVGGCQVWIGFAEAELWVYSSSMVGSLYATWEFLWKNRLDSSVKTILSQTWEQTGASSSDVRFLCVCGTSFSYFFSFLIVFVARTRSRRLWRWHVGRVLRLRHEEQEEFRRRLRDARLRFRARRS